MDPEQARLELDRCAGLVAEVLESWGGTAERLVGGSVLGVFGVPRPTRTTPVAPSRPAWSCWSARRCRSGPASAPAR